MIRQNLDIRKRHHGIYIGAINRPLIRHWQGAIGGHANGYGRGGCRLIIAGHNIRDCDGWGGCRYGGGNASRFGVIRPTAAPAATSGQAKPGKYGSHKWSFPVHEFRYRPLFPACPAEIGNGRPAEISTGH